MVESPGNLLRQTRLKKNLTIEDVARATRMRAERVEDLENDEYGNFPNLSYGRNFLLLYARHLGLDPQEVSELSQQTEQFSVDDYEYLSKGSDKQLPVIEAPRKSAGPILLIVVLLGVCLLVAYFVISIQRIGIGETSDVTATEAVPEPMIDPGPVQMADTPGPAISPTPSPTALQALPAVPASPPEPEAEMTVMRAVPVDPGEIPAVAGNEIVLRAIQRTWVKVRQGGRDSPVVFENYLSPDAQPLTMRGDRFYIEAEGNGANLRITKNGQEIAYSAPGISIE